MPSPAPGSTTELTNAGPYQTVAFKKSSIPFWYARTHSRVLLDGTNISSMGVTDEGMVHSGIQARRDEGLRN